MSTPSSSDASEQNQDQNKKLLIYHVTNILGTESEPGWNFVRRSVNVDHTYDGLLVGLPTSNFCTTLFYDYRSSEIRLPDDSPYPTGSRDNTIHWRCHTYIVLDDYDVYNMHSYSHSSGTSGTSQVQLLLLKKGENEILATELQKLKIEGDSKLYKKYFPVDKKLRNSFSSEKKWVNIHFVEDFQVNHNVKWDTVKKRSTKKRRCGRYRAWNEQCKRPMDCGCEGKGETNLQGLVI